MISRPKEKPPQPKLEGFRVLNKKVTNHPLLIDHQKAPDLFHQSGLLKTQSQDPKPAKVPMFSRQAELVKHSPELTHFLHALNFR
jgi:hypothetical protein